MNSCFIGFYETVVSSISCIYFTKNLFETHATVKERNASKNLHYLDYIKKSQAQFIMNYISIIIIKFIELIETENSKDVVNTYN